MDRHPVPLLRAWEKVDPSWVRVGTSPPGFSPGALGYAIYKLGLYLGSSTELPAFPERQMPSLPRKSLIFPYREYSHRKQKSHLKCHAVYVGGFDQPVREAGLFPRTCWKQGLFKSLATQSISKIDHVCLGLLSM